MAQHSAQNTVLHCRPLLSGLLHLFGDLQHTSDIQRVVILTYKLRFKAEKNR